jgi:formylmethanofuran dehydrogenase subunit B
MNRPLDRQQVNRPGNALMPAETAITTRTVDDATCTFCGCLCDDITLNCTGDRITEAKNACALGESWFFSRRQEAGPACLIEGQPASMEDAIERAAKVLTEAKYPIVHGLSDTTSEAQRLAVSIADWIGGCIDTTTSSAHGPSIIALQEVGEVTCTLGEVRNRGDLIVFWACDPAKTDPRHTSRYSLSPRGTFVPRGRDDRTCIVVDVHQTETADLADQFVRIKPGSEFESLWTLRALIKGIELDPDAIEAATGAQVTVWRSLIDKMKQARYGVLVFAVKPDEHLKSFALFSLVRDMNAHTRFVCVPLRAGGNVTGADEVLTWQTGYSFAVNLTRGYPRFNPGEYSTDDTLGRGEADAALIIAGDPMSCLSQPAREHLSRIPSIVLDHEETLTTRNATVLFRTATYGINTPGTVYRGDGVPIVLRPAVDSSLPSDVEVLMGLERRVRELGRTP